MFSYTILLLLQKLHPFSICGPDLFQSWSPTRPAETGEITRIPQMEYIWKSDGGKFAGKAPSERQLKSI